MVSSLTIILKDILRNFIAFVDLSSVYYYILPEFFLANGIIILLGYGILVFKPDLISVRRLINYVIGFITGLLIFMLILLTQFSSYILPYRHVNNLLYFWDQFTVDYIALTFKILLLFVFICLIIILRVYLDQQKMHIFEYVFLMLTSLFGSFIILSANDFLLLYLAIELQALSFYVLAAFNTKSKFSAEGAIKYFIIGSMASAFYLFGVMLLYGVTGTTNFYDLHLCALHLINSKVLATSFIFLLVSLFIKVGAAPFHMWVPDVYQGSPLPVTAFFATVPKIVLLTVFLRLVYYVSAPKLYVDLSCEMNRGFSNDLVFFSEMSMFFDGFYSILASNLFWVVGIVSIFVSVFGGLGQTQLKRLFAYSSIGNIGFIFLALSTNNIESIHAAFVYLVI
jgi:NADH-quinone oxidoreductase subunit N